jgi:iron complex transport system ATP-binding protein
MSDMMIRDVCYSYEPPRYALSGVSFDIPEGRFCGIIGPNGSGKSTLLGCISGYLQPERGSVSIGGQNVASLSVRDIARRMALVQQHASLEYDFTVGDIVLTGRNPYLKRWQSETKDDYAMMNDALQTAGITHLKDRMITTLSGGEWQMMILARALCQQADIMLLDEPVTGLDISHQVSIMGTVRRLAAQRGISVVCVLHDLNLALSYCDQIVLLKSGEVYADGAPQDVLTREKIENVYGTAVHKFEQDGKTFILPVMGA